MNRICMERVRAIAKLCKLPYQNLTWRQDVVMLALVYFLGGWLVLKMPQSQYGSPFWPPVGIALGALLSRGIDRWLGIYLGAFLISVLINKVPFPLALITSSSPTIGCIISAFLITRFTHNSYPFDRLRHVLIFIIISLGTGTIYQAIMGDMMGLFLGFVHRENLLSSLVNWWAGDSIGILVFTPLIISWTRSRTVSKLLVSQKAEIIFIALALFIISLLCLIKSQPIEYLILPPLLWSAFRLGDRVTSLFVAIVATAAATVTAYEIGVFFKSAQVNDSLVLLQLFIGVISITTMTVLSIVTENQTANKIISKQVQITQDALTKLDHLNKNLEKIVEERTLEIKQANLEITKLNHKLKADNIRMSSELEITRRLQNMILPTTVELEQIQELDIAGIMEPADEVGGDYYDVLSYEGITKIGIGDVTGHGLESGVIMIMVQTAIRTLMLHGETNQTKFFDTINKTIYENIKRMQSDRNLSLILLDYYNNTLSLSGQHESVIIVRQNGTIEEIDTDPYGFPIGLTDDITEFIDEIKIPLSVGEVVVLYTDGIIEAINKQKDYYGIDRLKEVLRQNYHKSAAKIRESIITDLHEHIGDYKIFDDITLVVIKRK